MFLALLLTQADLPSQAFSISCVSLHVSLHNSFFYASHLSWHCHYGNISWVIENHKVLLSQRSNAVNLLQKTPTTHKKSQLQVTPSLQGVLYFPCLSKQPTSDNEMLKAIRERIRFHLPGPSGSILCNNKWVFLSHSISLEMRQNLCILTAFYN